MSKLNWQTLQSDWIRQNCANQMEKVRDNYNCQTDNIKGFRQYGSTQLQGVRDQYYEQVGYIIVTFYQNLLKDECKFPSYLKYCQYFFLDAPY